MTPPSAFLLPPSSFDRLSLAWLAALALVILIIFPDFGMTWDEGVQNDYGKLVLAYYASLFTGTPDTRFLGFLDLYNYGALFDGVCAFVNRFSPFDEFDTRHLINALCGWIGILGVWRLSRHVAGPKTGLVAVVLLSVTPPYFGDMFANPKDIPFAVGYVWSVYYIILCRPFFPHVPLNLCLKTGLTIGLTLGIRFGGLLLLCYLGLFMAVFLIGAGIRDRRASLAMVIPLARSFFLIALISYTIMVLCWPWTQLNPVMNPLIALQNLSHSESGASAVLFNGVFVDTMKLPFSYVPVNLAIKLPEITLMVLIAGLAIALEQAVKQERLSSATVARLLPNVDRLIVGFAFVFPVIYVIAVGAKMYDGLRHVLFVVPMLTVLAAMSAVPLIETVQRQAKAIRIGAAVLVAGYLIYHIGTMAALHPYQYVYYNRFIGGLKGAEGRFETDYWGAAHREAVRRLVAHLDREGDRSPYRIAVCFNPFLAAYYLPPNLTMTDDITQTDFLLATTRGDCHKWVKKGTVLFQVERSGAPLMVVKDLRE